MGQNYSTSLPAGPSTIETTELSDLTFERPLGGARLLRSVRCRHQDGVVVVKTYAKQSPTFPLKRYARALKLERSQTADIVNVLPYQKIRETASAGILVRQFIHSSLYDRISLRPFLENIEKKWIAFQLLCAVRDCHARGVYHADIKSENVLVTSWGWVYLTDFASTWKPVHLPEDNPNTFSTYYDTSARRTCYIAPERFLPSGEVAADDRAQWNMDVFSVGCVIAELFTEGPTFTLSQLLRYRRGDYDPTVSLLNKIDDDNVRALISSMIRLDPQERWHAQDYLDEYKGKMFPLYFYQHLHVLMQEITDPSSGRRSVTVSDANNGESDDRIDRIYHDFEMLSVSLGYDNTPHSKNTRLPGAGRGLFPMQVDLPNHRHTATSGLVTAGDNGTFILLNIITASLRSVARASSKIRACELLLAFAERVPDEAKMDRILPYIMPMLEDTDEMVLVVGLRTMTQLLSLVRVVSPVNSFLFTQYIFPRLQAFVLRKEFKHHPIVRATYAACLASLAETASRFLDMMQALRAEGSLPAASKDEEDLDAGQGTQDNYDATRQEMLDAFESQTKVFLTDTDIAVRRAFLSSVSSLCVFFGESRASDVILSHLNTYLNDPDWLLKCAFFRIIVGVAVYVGGASLEDFILPLMLQALTDPQEFVVEQALRSLASMAEIGLLQRATTWELIDTVARFEIHPNMWIKEAACHFVSAATTFLSTADIRILVAPLVQPYLKVPVCDVTETELLDALRKPIPRSVLDLALQWAERGDKSTFWKQARGCKQLSYRASGSMPSASSVADLTSKTLSRLPKTSEDEQWLGRLRNAGMRGEDEIKILAFREYLWRAGQRTRRDSESRNDKSDSDYDQVVSLTKLGITPQTVIFDADVDIYSQRMQGQDGSTDLSQALQDATKGDKLDAAQKPQSNLSAANKPANRLDLPELKQRHSGSGQSLSSSPSSGVGLLGDRSSRQRINAAGLLRGEDARNKSRPETATDDTVAAGRLNTPSSGARRKASPADGTEKQGQALARTISSRAGHNYAGNDPTVLRLLDAVYVDSFPTDSAEFGPLVQPLKRSPIPYSNGSPPKTVWRPRGQLVAVLGEHVGRVNRIVVAPNHAFFVTGGDDGFVRVWDSSRLERNVSHRSKSKQSVGEGVHVTSLCFIESTHSFICTGSDGTVHFFKVPVSDGGEHGPRVGSIQLLRTWQLPRSTTANEHAVWSEHYRGENGSTLVLATSLGRILVVELRSMSVTYELQNPAQHGTPTSFCMSRHHDWLLVGTTHGILDLWDLRFRLRLRSWVFPNAAPITRLQLYPSKRSLKKNRVCISGGSGRGEITVWSIEKLICHEIYQPADASGGKRVDPKNYELRNLDDERSESLLSRVAGAAGAEQNDGVPRSDTSASFAAMHFALNPSAKDEDSQPVLAITGGPDDKVRFWDSEGPDGCTVVSGTGAGMESIFTISSLGLDTKVLTEKFQPTAKSADGGGDASRKRAVSTSAQGGRAGRNEAIRTSAQSLLDRHLDTVTDVAILERPFGMVLSADRSGQIFVHQ